jgi:hypothetical protein
MEKIYNNIGILQYDMMKIGVYSLLKELYLEPCWCMLVKRSEIPDHIMQLLNNLHC